MKYVVVLSDGMAGRPLSETGWEDYAGSSGDAGDG